jgi:hypothetical protein
MRHLLVSFSIIALLSSNAAALSSEFDTGSETIVCESQPSGNQKSVYFVIGIDLTKQIVRVWSGDSLDKITPEATREHPLVKLMLNQWSREDAIGVMKPFKFVDTAIWRNTAGHMFAYSDAGSSFGTATRPFLEFDADLPKSPTNWLIMCQIVENSIK